MLLWINFKLDKVIGQNAALFWYVQDQFHSYHVVYIWHTSCIYGKYYYVLPSLILIAQPAFWGLQWTIANLVGADWPAKRQKKPSCVFTGRAGLVLFIRQVAHCTFFLSRQSDVIASFSFGACTMQTDFCEIKFLVVYCENTWIFYFSVISTDSCQYIAHYVLTWPEAKSMRPCYGEFWQPFFLCQM